MPWIQNALKCANMGENLICHSRNVNAYIFVDVALLLASLCVTLYRKNNSGFVFFFLTCLSSLAPKRESQTGGTGRGPQSNVTAQCQRHHNRGSVCDGKSKWAHTHLHKNTHTKTSLCSWADSHWLARCSLSVNRRALCRLQQEPAAETCYCATCRPKQN